MNKDKTYTISEKAYQNKLAYIAEYNKKMTRITIQITKEQREKIKALAKSKNMTIKDLILQALENYN